EPEDDSIEAAARREVLEETGVTCVTQDVPTLAGIDVHGIPSNGREPYHLHHDLLFYFRAHASEIQVSEETHAVTWRTLSELDTCGIPSNVRLVRAGGTEPGLFLTSQPLVFVNFPTVLIPPVCRPPF